MSYSRDGEQHREWVLGLACDLAENGVKVIADLGLRPGAELTHFMERGVRESDYVLIVCTPPYAYKADNRIGGVGYEASILTAEIFASAPAHKFVPILRSGSMRESFPAFLGSRYAIDFRADRDYGRGLTELVRHLWDEPEVGGFVAGKRPNFGTGFRACRAGAKRPRPRQPKAPRRGAVEPRPVVSADTEDTVRQPGSHPAHTLSWARGRYDAVVAENARIFDARHRITLASRHDWAKRIGAAGDPAEAARLYAELAADYAKVHGPDHRGPLAARRQQAWWTWQAGDHDEARRLYTALNTYFTGRLGPGHRYSRTSRDALESLR